MKSTIKIAMLFALVASAVFAVPVVTMGLTGGAHTATPNAELDYVLSGYSPSASTSTSFITFCLERNEYFSPSLSYNVVLSDRAVNGGLTLTPGYDILSQGTSWLYSQYAQGTLAGFVYGNSALNGDFQQAVWALEGEWGLTSMSPYFAQLLIAQFGSRENAALDGSYGLYGVRALNLTDDNGNRAQDQLVFVGGGKEREVADTGLSTLFMFAGVLGIMATRVRFV